MAEISDPRIRDIMAKLNNTYNPQARTEEEAEPEPQVSIKPPQTLEEFIAAEKLDEWPQRITSENLLDLSQERELLGSKDMIQEELRRATLLDMGVLNDLHNRLQLFENRINAVADQMVVDPPEPMENGGSTLPMSVSRAFLTEPREHDVLKVHPCRKKKASDFKDAIRQRSVDYCNFPGYRQGELTELPAQLEAPQILNRITKVQDFNSGFKRFWKKIFQSEASVAMMQDTFWWFFIENFEKDQRKDQNKLFNRIADSFVALFTSVNPEIKDKVFTAYSDCLSQAIFVAFREAFPESDRHFQDEFKRQLVATTSEWVTGIKETGDSWKNWDLKRLQLRSQKPTTDHADSKANVASKLDMSMLSGDVKQSLDLADFQRSIQQLGNSSSPDKLPSISFTTSTAPISRELSKITEGVVVTAPPPQPTTGVVALIKSTRPAESRTLVGPVESSKIGPGAEMERVMFNLQGQSPLVSHFLYTRQLRSKKVPGRRVRRTHITKEPTETKTYREVIQEATQEQSKMSSEYRQICDITQAEIYKIEKQQREASRKIEQLQKQMNSCRSSMEVKLMGERLLQSARLQDEGGFGTQQPTELKALMIREKED